MEKKQDNMISEMVETIVETVKPEKVILFGSRAKGKARKDSDVDLLIIESESFSGKKSRFQEMARVSRSLSRFRVPIDLLIYSREEIRRWKNSINHIIAHALREGKIVYER
jgi:uncharacterized protein